jgi:hypothetical protein
MDGKRRQSSPRHPRSPLPRQQPIRVTVHKQKSGSSTALPATPRPAAPRPPTRKIEED